MSREKNLIISVYDYFDFLDYPHLNLEERIVRLLFYVTSIAHLRSDMTPSIVTQRLDDIKTYFSRRSVERIGYDIAPTDYESVRSTMENNRNVFTILEETDKRDRNNEEIAYSLSVNTVQELESELVSLRDFIGDIRAKEKELKKEEKETAQLKKFANHIKKNRVLLKIVFYYCVIAFFLILGILSVFWINEDWNFVGRKVSAILSRENPLLGNIIGSLAVNIFTAIIMSPKISKHKRLLKMLILEEF